ncbi:LOW QUALITY PROTEIN: SNF-related serine/threonine-protein kinase-like [Menidia menidia]
MAGIKRHHDGKVAGLYDLDKTLGRGHFAVVKLARHVFTGEKVAVKVIDKTKLDAVARGHLFQEVRCMKMVQHPNVVRLYEVIDTASKLYLILELGDGGDMYDCIMRHDGGLSEEVAKCYFAQIVHAISYCHRLHVVHRDLKPENVVFFQKQGVVKLTDFGFSNRFQPGKTLNTSCGSLAYSAPEILLGDEYDAPAVDIWSLGVILFMLVCGQPPFQEANDSETLTMIMDCRYSVPPHISPACRDLIGHMLQRDPRRRATLEQIGGHGWLRGVDPSPATRLSTPLASHRSLSEDQHGSIVQRMVRGAIADRDAITEALESNQYNHITATYFLLAERMLRDRQEKETSQTRSPSPSKAQFRQSWPTRVDVHQDVGDGLGGPAMSHPGGASPPARSAESLHKGPRPKTALLDLGPRPPPPPGPPRPLGKGPPPGPLRPGKPRSPSLFSVEEGEEEEEEGEGGGEEEEEEEEEEWGGDKCLPPSSLPTQVVLRRKASPGNRMTSRRSAPVLNQIHEEEREEEEEEKEKEKEEEEEEGEDQDQEEKGGLAGLCPPKQGLILGLNSRVFPPEATDSGTQVQPNGEGAGPDGEGGAGPDSEGAGPDSEGAGPDRHIGDPPQGHQGPQGATKTYRDPPGATRTI